MGSHVRFVQIVWIGGQIGGQTQWKRPLEPVSRFKRAVCLVETGEASSLATPHRFSIAFAVRPEWGAYTVAWREAA